MPSNNYPSRVQVLTRNLNVNDIGEEEECFTRGRYMWCRIDEENGRSLDEFGGKQTGIDATIYVRNYPTVNALDMFEDCFGRMWKIETRHTGTNEIICECYTDDELIDWVECEDEDSDSDD